MLFRLGDRPAEHPDTLWPRVYKTALFVQDNKRILINRSIAIFRLSLSHYCHSFLFPELVSDSFVDEFYSSIH